MTFSREDYAQSLKEGREKAHSNGRHSLQDISMVMQAGLSAESVTNHPDWDRFLSMIQAAIEKTDEQRQGYRELLESSALVDPNEIQKIRVQLIICNERISAWKVVIDMPKELMSNAADAIDIMERMPSV